MYLIENAPVLTSLYFLKSLKSFKHSTIIFFPFILRLLFVLLNNFWVSLWIHVSFTNLFPWTKITVGFSPRLICHSLASESTTHLILYPSSRAPRHPWKHLCFPTVRCFRPILTSSCSKKDQASFKNSWFI